MFLQLIPIEIDPVNSGVLGETAGENEEKDRKNLSVDHSDIIKYSSLH